MEGRHRLAADRSNPQPLGYVEDAGRVERRFLGRRRGRHRAALSLGTDGGGSIRIPAGFSGIFGHKPSFGRVPAWPLSPFGTVSHVGPMTRTVEDSALMLNVIAEPDARDWHALPYDGAPTIAAN